jgi:hypothetical protein
MLRPREVSIKGFQNPPRFDYRGIFWYTVALTVILWLDHGIQKLFSGGS